MKARLEVKGMHCASCEMLVSEALEEIGVRSNPSHEKGTVEVEFDGSEKTLDNIRKAINHEGYEVIG